MCEGGFCRVEGEERPVRKRVEDEQREIAASLHPHSHNRKRQEKSGVCICFDDLSSSSSSSSGSGGTATESKNDGNNGIDNDENQITRAGEVIDSLGNSTTTNEDEENNNIPIIAGICY